MRYLNLIILTLGLSFLLNGLTLAAAPNINLQAHQGILDVKDTIKAHDTVVALNGEWEFYWEQLLTPEDFNVYKPQLSGYINLPGYWNDFKLNGQTLGGKGFATLRLVVKNIHPSRNFFLKIPGINSAYRLYVNGLQIDSCGTVGVTEDRSSPKICALSPAFYLDQPRIELILQISNFNQAKGGINESIAIYDFRIYESNLIWKLAFDLFLIGVLMIVGLYNLGVYALRREERSTLYFSLFCLVIALRTSFLNSTFFMMAFPDFNWEWYQRMDFLTLVISPLLFGAYMYYLFPREFSKKVYRGVTAVAVILSILVVSLSIYQLTSLLTLFQLPILFVCFYVVYAFILASIHRQTGADEMLLGSIILVAAVINDILNAQSIINTNYIAGYGLLVFLFSQFYVVTRLYIGALKTSEELSADLELKVKDQTAEISDLLDNTGQGILSFDSNMIIQQHTSKATKTIFGKSISGENVLNLMFSDKKEDLSGYFEVVFRLNGEMRQVKNLLPTEFFHNERFYDIAFKWIPEGKKSPSRIMVLLTDITTKKKLEKMLEKDERRNQKIIRIAVDRHGFLGFYNNIKQLLTEITISLNLNKSEIDLVKIARKFHTIKGGVAGYSFVEVADIAHQAEALMEKIINGKQELTDQLTKQLLAFVDQVGSVFDDKISELGDLIPKQFLSIGNMPFYRISEEKIEQLEKHLKKRLPDDQTLETMLIDLRKQPVRNMVKKLASDAKDLAFQLGKQIEVHYQGEETKIIHNTFESFFTNLVHLVRNAVDHGIEFPVERLKLGKPEVGNLNIDISHKNKVFELIFSDDGRGMDLEALKERAKQRGLITDDQARNMSDEEAKMLIFQPGLSTRNESNTISGRGLGMGAVSESVKDLGGAIAIDSQLGKGTRYTINIPADF